MNDRAYLRKEDQARGHGDLKHAYDGVQPWAVEIVLMRMGLPEGFVQYQSKLIAQTRTAMITPFGVTDKFRRASGLPQGGTHSCALWNGFIDIMAEMQHGLAEEKGVMVEGEWGKEWELIIQLFADDAHHCASGENRVQGFEERFKIATLWSASFGTEHLLATKCNAVVGRCQEGKWAKDRRRTNSGMEEVVRIYYLHEDIYCRGCTQGRDRGRSESTRCASKHGGLLEGGSREDTGKSRGDNQGYETDAIG